MSIFSYRQSRLKSFEETIKAAGSDQSSLKDCLRKLLEEFPYLFGYWLRLAKLDSSVWPEALEKCPSLELWTAWCKQQDTTEKRFEDAVKQVGFYYKSHILWDEYLAYVEKQDDTGYLEAKVLAKLSKIPLYEYSKYIKKSRKAMAEHGDVFEGIKLETHAKELSEKVNAKWVYESKLTRGYFHVVPLKEEELKAWDDYLTWSETHESDEQTHSLYRQALVCLALYPAFWLKYARWLRRAHPEKLKDCFDNARLWAQSASETETRNNTDTIALQEALYAEEAGDLEAAKALYVSMQPEFQASSQALQLMRKRQETADSTSKAEPKQMKGRANDAFDLQEYFERDIRDNGSNAAKLLLKSGKRLKPATKKHQS